MYTYIQDLYVNLKKDIANFASSSNIFYTCKHRRLKALVQFASLFADLLYVMITIQKL